MGMTNVGELKISLSADGLGAIESDFARAKTTLKQYTEQAKLLTTQNSIGAASAVAAAKAQLEKARAEAAGLEAARRSLATERELAVASVSAAATDEQRAVALNALALARRDELAMAKAAAAALSLEKTALAAVASASSNLAMVKSEERAASLQRYQAYLREQQAMAGVGAQMNRTGGAISVFAKNSKYAMGQVGMQFQDVLVQAEMGTDVFRIIAQQGSQLFSVFSPLAGAGVALGAILAGSLYHGLMDASEGTETLDDAMTALGKTISVTRDGTKELSEDFKRLAKSNEDLARAKLGGALSEAMAAVQAAATQTRKVLDETFDTESLKFWEDGGESIQKANLALRQIVSSGADAGNVLRRMSGNTTWLSGDFEELDAVVSSLRDKFKLTAEQAATLIPALAGVASGGGTAALEELSAAILAVNQETKFSKKELTALGGTVAELAAKGREASDIAQFAKDALGKLGIQAAITNAEFEKDLKIQRERTLVAGKSERQQAIAAAEAKYSIGEQRDQMIALINAEHDAKEAAEALKKAERDRADEIKKKAADLRRSLERQAKDYLDQLMAARRFAEESITGGLGGTAKLKREYDEQLALFRQHQADMETLGYDSADVQRGIRAKLFDDLNELNERQIKDAQEQAEKSQGYWESYAQSVREASQNTDELLQETLSNFSRNVSTSVTDAIFEWEGMGNLAATVMEATARSMIQSLIEVGVQKLTLWALDKTIAASAGAGYVAQVTGQAQAASYLAAINAYASAAAVPLTGYLIAPGAASTALALTQSAASAATVAAAASIAGIAHGGMDYIPRESTFLLQKGERVLSPNQNRDLTAFLRGDGDGGVTVNFNVSAIDASGMDQVLNRHKSTIYNLVRSAKRNEGVRF